MKLNRAQQLAFHVLALAGAEPGDRFELHSAKTGVKVETQDSPGGVIFYFAADGERELVGNVNGAARRYAELFAEGLPSAGDSNGPS